MSDSERWENHIDFYPVPGNPAALLAEFKEFIRLTNEPVWRDTRSPMHLRYQAWLWNRNIFTVSIEDNK